MTANTNSVIWALVASPVVLFAGYVAYLVVPEVVRVVVPLVIDEVISVPH